MIYAEARLSWFYNAAGDTTRFDQVGGLGGNRRPFDTLQCMFCIRAMEDYLFTEDELACQPLTLIYNMFLTNARAQITELRGYLRKLNRDDPQSNTGWSTRFKSAIIRSGVMEIQSALFTYLYESPADSKTLLSQTIREMPSPLDSMHSVMTATRDIQMQLSETLQNIANTITIETGTLTVRHAEDARRQADEAQKHAEQALKQTKQGLFWTRLAAIYLPLSLAASLFSMQLQEFDNPPHWWAFICLAVALLVLTLLVLKLGGGDQGSELSWTWHKHRTSVSSDSASCSTKVDVPGNEHIKVDEEAAALAKQIPGNGEWIGRDYNAFYRDEYPDMPGPTKPPPPPTSAYPNDPP